MGQPFTAISRLRQAHALPALVVLVVMCVAGAASGLAGAGWHVAAAAAPERSTADGGSAEARAHALMDAEPPDWAGAREAFREAAEDGSPTAMSHLGWMYEEGHGVAVDGEQAAYWYGQAARAGAWQFAVKLGWMHLGGQGVAQDRLKAEEWFGRAVEADHAPAMVAWASVLIGDAQGGRDPERVFEARDLLDRSLADGQTLAAWFITRLYIEGIGGHPIDDARAAHHARITADTGHARAQGWLALMSLEGRGVPVDPVAAAKWANLAAAGGDPLGIELRLGLESTLEPEQLQAARERAVRWALERR